MPSQALSRAAWDSALAAGCTQIMASDKAAAGEASDTVTGCAVTGGEGALQNRTFAGVSAPLGQLPGECRVMSCSRTPRANSGRWLKTDA